MIGTRAKPAEWHSLHAHHGAVKEVLEHIGFSKAEVERCMGACGYTQKKWDELVDAGRVSASNGTPGQKAKRAATRQVRTMGHKVWREMLLLMAGGICFICSKPLGTDLELCHDDEIMKNHSCKKVLAQERKADVWHAYASHVWHVPFANFNGELSCLKDEAAKCHFGHGKCNTEMDRPGGDVKYRATDTDNAEEHWAALVAANTPGFRSTLRDHLSACPECRAMLT